MADFCKFWLSNEQLADIAEIDSQWISSTLENTCASGTL